MALRANRHHFESVTVVTSTADAPDVRVITDANDADLLRTDLFYADGAAFNKFRAVEWALDAIGRHGWLCLLDADVIWPKVLPPIDLVPGKLYTPLRRMAPWPLSPIPPESEWGRYPIHRNVREFAGYSQWFHADDPVLGTAPWHDVSWLTAGGADSFFQLKWPPHLKIRPPFEVLHLGEPGVNWAGRVTAYADGKRPEGADERKAALRSMLRKRGSVPGDPFFHERFPKSE